MGVPSTSSRALINEEKRSKVKGLGRRRREGRGDPASSNGRSKSAKPKLRLSVEKSGNSGRESKEEAEDSLECLLLVGVDGVMERAENCAGSIWTQMRTGSKNRGRREETDLW